MVAVADEVSLPPGEPQVVTVGDDDVLLVRVGTEIRSISNVCSHAGGPLNEGSFDEPGCVTCPWHGSTFRLADGGIVRGPASTPEPAYETRVREGWIEVRARA